MTDLGMIIRATQADAAAFSTEALRHEIELNLDVQDAAIAQFYSVTRLGGGNLEDLIVATSTVMISFVMTALYVRELTARPRDTWTVIPITWRNRRSGVSKLKIREMGSRYLFIALYCWLEKYFSRGDYRAK